MWRPRSPAPAAAAASSISASASSTCIHGRRVVARGSSSSAASAPALPVPLPPAGYDYKADILPGTRAIVAHRYPQLLDLVEAGHLVVHERPASYVERRTDGYQEPQLVFLLGTAHVSQASAHEVARVVAAVQPDAVVVELCKSRAGVLQAAPQERRQAWALQYEQQRLVMHAASRDAAAASAASSSSASASLDEEQQQQQQLVAVAPAAAPAAAAAAAAALPPQPGASSSTSTWWPPQLLAVGRAGSSSSSSSKASNPLSLGGTNPLAALSRSAALGGQQAMLLRLLLAGQARKAADQLGVEPGAEFRAAAEAAAAVAGGGCCLVLGDRPIEITLQRAWDALTWPRRLQLLRDLLGAAGALAPASEGRAAAWGSAPLTQSQVEALRSDDAVSALFAAMSARYPELVPPLVHERDMYLAWSLNRSKAVAGARAVVGCIGKGHLRGVVYALRSDPGQLRFRDLVGGKNSKRGRRAAAAAAAQRLAVELLVGTALWAAWVAWSSAPQLQQ